MTERPSPDPVDEAASLRSTHRRRLGAWLERSVKHAAVASFGFVETMGLAYGPKLLGDALGWTRPVPDPASPGRSRPSLELDSIDGRELGISRAAQVDIAESLLRGMSLTQTFAPLLVLVGHGASTVNNPHATGLDCGACGGHSGAVNARVAAAILNDRTVRAELQARGISIPERTHVLAGLHDTTTDDIELFDADQVPASLSCELERLQARLERAAPIARARRATSLGLEPGDDGKLSAHSRDWSQTRPEWGLAGCAALIVAPRSRTRGRDLGGRAFLHDYDWRQDPEFAVLEGIMTAPMVVASWIALQYYASTVDNRVFGCGTKLLHDVVGQVGVLEGRAGDLRSGLAWESVHDGRRLVHEPVRLSVVIEAPDEAIQAIVERQPKLRQLLDNGWIHLFGSDGDHLVPLSPRRCSSPCRCR